MRDKWLGSLLTAITVAVLLAFPIPVLGKAGQPWGVLAEVVERDFYLGEAFGKSSAISFRWEEVGKRMIVSNAAGLAGNQKWLLTLDAKNEIVKTTVGWESNGSYSLTASEDGTLTYVLDATQTFLASNGDGTYKFGRQDLVPIDPQAPTPRLLKAIAAGKVRPANPDLRSVVAAKAVSIDTRTAAVTPPAGYKGRMVKLPVDEPVEVALTKLDKWHGLGFRIVCVPLPESDGGPFRLSVNATGRVLSGLSADCTYGGMHDREGGLSYRFYSTKEQPYAMVIGQKDTSLQLTLHRMSPEEVAQWKVDQRNEAIAANQRAASSGNSGSGLFGALAMGLGAALAGGNAEQVMGMAMKGAELTTDNEMSRNVLAGQGDAMVAEGTQRMIAENARSNSAGTAGAVSPTTDVSGGVQVAGNGSAPSLTKTSAQAYFVVGMTPTAANTRNPMCQSTAFTIEFEHEANKWGDNGRAQAVLKEHESRFLEKCSRHGQVYGVVNGNVEGLTSGFPMATPHAQDFVVQMP